MDSRRSEPFLILMHSNALSETLCAKKSRVVRTKRRRRDSAGQKRCGRANNEDH